MIVTFLLNPICQFAAGLLLPPVAARFASPIVQRSLKQVCTPTLNLSSRKLTLLSFAGYVAFIALKATTWAMVILPLGAFGLGFALSRLLGKSSDTRPAYPGLASNPYQTSTHRRKGDTHKSPVPTDPHQVREELKPTGGFAPTRQNEFFGPAHIGLSPNIPNQPDTIIGNFASAPPAQMLHRPAPYAPGYNTPNQPDTIIGNFASAPPAPNEWSLSPNVPSKANTSTGKVVQQQALIQGSFEFKTTGPLLNSRFTGGEPTYIVSEETVYGPPLCPGTIQEKKYSVAPPPKNLPKGHICSLLNRWPQWQGQTESGSFFVFSDDQLITISWKRESDKLFLLDTNGNWKIYSDPITPNSRISKRELNSLLKEMGLYVLLKFNQEIFSLAYNSDPSRLLQKKIGPSITLYLEKYTCYLEYNSPTHGNVKLCKIEKEGAPTSLLFKLESAPTEPPFELKFCSNGFGSFQFEIAEPDRLETTLALLRKAREEE